MGSKLDTTNKMFKKKKKKKDDLQLIHGPAAVPLFEITVVINH